MEAEQSVVNNPVKMSKMMHQLQAELDAKAEKKRAKKDAKKAKKDAKKVYFSMAKENAVFVCFVLRCSFASGFTRVLLVLSACAAVVLCSSQPCLLLVLMIML